ncbi:helix-hairpin-helix domain-containing protein [Chitinophaga silvatica]|uniref:Helix-hairpin-helix domain-containing protein n=1 Tax=Chitinophaga silvatica TaxID=2282649 RepID=A0A3E1Y4D7_9BACT|nr:helix-hairpin-helix domain-containing protein [Chitinophaga silvatica]RFS19492.1 helix-hairpin-helix domain-containing protein [Chitinophaga silvatica]
MNFKKTAGLVLSIFLGIFPLLNLLAASIFTFFSKKKVWALTFLIVAVLTFICSRISTFHSTNEKSAKRLFVLAFQSNLRNVRITSKTALNAGDLEKALNDVLVLTSEQVIKMDNKVGGLLANAKNGSLNKKEVEAFQELNAKLHSYYLSNIPFRNGTGKYDFTIIEAEDKDSFISNSSAKFLEKYIDAETGTLESIFGFFYFFGYAFGLVGSIHFGKKLFTSSGEKTFDEPMIQASGNTSYSPENANYHSREDIQVGVPDQPGMIININIADESALVALPGINRILAKSIVSERNLNGYYKNLSDLKNRMSLSLEQYSKLLPLTEFYIEPAGGNKPGRVV